MLLLQQTVVLIGAGKFHLVVLHIVIILMRMKEILLKAVVTDGHRSINVIS